MVSRSRSALVALVALACLAVPAAALYGRLTVYFLAAFDGQTKPGETQPKADSGHISVNGPGFSVVPAQMGGALLVQGTGMPVDVTLEGYFDKVFKGSELVVSWVITPAQDCSEFSLRCLEDTDGEIIDAGWNDDGTVDVAQVTVGHYDEGVRLSCTLTLRDNFIGGDTWTFTMTPEGGVPITKTGPLALWKPLYVCAIELVLPAGSMGTFVLDDLQAVSTGYKSK